MAGETVTPFPGPFEHHPNPFERLGHKVETVLPWLGRHWKSLSLAAAAAIIPAAGAVYLFITHDRGPQTSPQPNNPTSDTIKDPSTEIGATIPTLVPREVPPTATATATATSTTTPEVRKDIPCVILPIEYCSKAELVERISAKGESSKGVGVKVDPGTKIFSPIAGSASKRESDTGFVATINNPNDPTGLVHGIQGDIVFYNPNTEDKVEKGQEIGYVGTKHYPSPLGDYNLRISSNIIENGKLVDNPGALQKLFPEAFENGVVRVIDLRNSDSTSAKTTYLTPSYR
ncbi:MAG: hypothetical protein PHE48_03575 [Candidatus Daviesbacteria bacterium]|nr:hypothetical protein [Candidatus Daviesbacteria bacterium]